VTTTVESARAELAGIVGESRVVSDQAACAALAVDGKAPQMVVYPTSPEQTAEALKCARAHQLAVIPCRNGTKLGLGNPPHRYDVALSLKEMNRVWHYEPADLTVSTEAGMKLGDFQHFLGRNGLWLPLDPSGGPWTSLGGILATNACGPLRLQYGAPRDMVLGMRVATTAGKVIKTGGRVVKNVAGYDLGKLLVGSYGTLGVIVEASFKLFPLPAKRATFVFPTGTLGIARDLRRRILNSPLQPARLVLLDGAAATLVRAGSALAAEIKEPELWVEAHGSGRVIERYARELEALGRGPGAPVRQLDDESSELLWSRISDPGGCLSEANPRLVLLKGSLPLAASEEFLSRTRQEVDSSRVRLASFSQVGVGTVHLCLLDEMPLAELAGLVQRLRDAVEGLGGVLVIEHCPSELKARIDVWGPAGEGFEVMRKLKAVWDPQGILAPGRFVGGL
jgi:glycolate oxidase FAD binding subunit